MHRPSVVLAIALASLAAAEAGQAQEPQPTLQFGGSCFTEGQAVPFSGAGYTPGGEVTLQFADAGAMRGAYTTNADASGALNDWFRVDDADQLLNADDEREPIDVTANDKTRIEAGQLPVESQFGVGTFTFTRWEAFSKGHFTPGKRSTVEIFGWAFATGKPAWFLFRKGSRTVASIPIGRLDNVCGDRKAKIKVPRRLKPGRYRVVLTTDRTLKGAYMWRTARVTLPGAVAAASNRGAMSRAGTAHTRLKPWHRPSVSGLLHAEL
jgi:hypothetical protein